MARTYTRVFYRGGAAKIQYVIERRMRSSIRLLKSRVQRNISVPVQYTGSGVIRSKPGEYPRKDTGLLRRTVATKIEFQHYGSVIHGHVGVTQDYGLELELNMDRKLLEATLIDEWPLIRSHLLAPIP